MASAHALALGARLLTFVRADGADPTLRAWTAGAYVSLLSAEEAGYRGTDEFHKNLDSGWAAAVLAKVIDSGLPTLSMAPDGSDHDLDLWLRGYFFNTALLRMACVLDNALSVLFERKILKIRTGVDPAPGDVPDYRFLIRWYRVHLKKKADFLDRVHAQFNTFKHGYWGPASKKKVEDLDDAWKALDELLELLELTVR